MTIPTSGAPVAAWYADPQDPSQLRWWDGTQWTAHTTPVPQAAPAAAPAAAAPAVQPAAAFMPPAYGERTEHAPVYTQPAEQAQAPMPSYAVQYTQPYAQQYGADAKVPESTPTANWLIWVFVFLPLLSLVSIFAWDFEGFMQETLTNPYASSTLLLDPGYLVLSLGSWVIYAAMVVLAFLDWRWLGQQGYPRRFHWAWTFLNSLIYIIGRSVVVKRQAGRGFAPMWAYIAMSVVSLVAIGIWTAMIMSAMFTMIEQIPGVVS